VGAAGDEAGDVGDVGGQDRADLAGDLGERGEVDRARDGRAASEDDLRALAAGEVADLVEVDEAGLARDAVRDGVEPLAGRGDGPAVGQVAAHRQGHAHDRVARVEERQVDGEVGRGAGVRLDVRVVDAEQRLGPLDRERLDLVDELLALVVALAGVALGVLVGEDRAARFEHRLGDVVFRGDHAQLVVLALGLALDEAGELRVSGGQVWDRWHVQSDLRACQ
jgi:hypothetical protein